MAWLKVFLDRLRALRDSDAVHREIDEEVRFHIDMRTDEYVRRGMSPEAARREAERRFGQLTRIKEMGYEVRGGGLVETLWQDLRYGARMLIKKPGFTIVAVLTLALGIGANTAIFSVVNAVLLTSLPYTEPSRIMMLWGRNPSLNLSQDDFPVSYPDFLDWRAKNQSFEYLAAIGPNSFNLSGEGDPERIGGVGASADFFKVLGVDAAWGRTFTSEEELDGGAPVVVISHNFWQSRFGADPGIVGRHITLDNRRYRIIGVMPAGFAFPQGNDLPEHFGFAEKVDVWTPLALKDYEVRQRGNRVLAVIGRLKSGVTPAQAQGEMSTIVRDLEQQYPNTSRGFGIEVLPLYEQLVGKIRPSLLLLSAAVAFVLLIACANVANLLLARATARQSEIAVRTALGASRWRIVRQLTTESLLLSLLGGTIGLLVSLWITDFLLALSPPNLTHINDVRINYRLLGFALLIILLTGLIFSLAPALQSSKPDLNTALKEGGRGASGGGHSLRKLLVIVEVSLTFILLVGAGLMIRSFARVQQEDIGFNPKNVLTMQVNLPLEQYKDRQQWNDFFGQFIERVKTIPGVESAAVTWQLPLKGAEGSVSFEIEGRPEDSSKRNWVGMRRVSPGYFQTMGITILQGRDLTRQDVQNVQAVVINHAMAQRYWPDEDPLGKRISVLGKTCEVVGIVKDVKNSTLEKEADPVPGVDILFHY